MYILDTSPLSYMCFVSIFSQLVACLFNLLTCLWQQKFFILMKSNLSIFSFVDQAFGVVSKNLLPIPRSPRFSPMLSSISFIVCILHLNIIPLWIKFFFCFCFYFCIWWPVITAPFVENIILSPLDWFCSSVKALSTIFVWVYFWALCCSIELFIFFFFLGRRRGNITLFWLCSFILNLKVR